VAFVLRSLGGVATALDRQRMLASAIAESFYEGFTLALFLAPLLAWLTWRRVTRAESTPK
jgi:hypothetical protein